MASEAQNKANRQNALKSTGSRTEQGKETVSQNATKHGLCSCKNVIRTESQEEYNIFHDEMIQDLSPVGAMEEMLASRIVNLSWRLKRAEVFQNAAMELMIDDRLTETLSDTQPARELAEQGDMSLIIGLALRRDFSNSKVLEELLIYEKRIESSLYKASAELRKLQKLRREKYTMDERREMRDENEFAKQSQFSRSHGLLAEVRGTHQMKTMNRCVVTHPTLSKDYAVTGTQNEKEISKSHPQASLEAATRCNIAKQIQFVTDQRPETQDIRKEIECNMKLNPIPPHGPARSLGWHAPDGQAQVRGT